MTDQTAHASLHTRYRDRFERPIFIISPPRSGSTLLFETLAQAPGLFTVGGESHRLIESLTAFAPRARGWSSNRLTAQDATSEAIEHMASGFYAALRDRDERPAQGRARMLEKTPKNALRIPFFDAAWPDATFVYLYRDARQTLSSMIEAWTSGRFRTYPRLPLWRGPPWSLLLVPGWPDLNGLPLPQIVAHQWAITTETLLGDIAQLPHERVAVVAYDDLLESPQATIESLATSLGLGWDRHLGNDLPFSKATVSRPSNDKWRAIEDVIMTIWPIVANADAKARAFVEKVRAA